MALLGVEPSDDHKAVLRSLGNGECIFRDLDGRAGRIGIDLISDELVRWLDTNPTRAKPEEPASPAAAAGQQQLSPGQTRDSTETTGDRSPRSA